MPAQVSARLEARPKARVMDILLLLVPRPSSGQRLILPLMKPTA